MGSSPAARLSEALATLLTEDRLTHILPKPGQSIREQVEDAILQYHTVDILRALHPEELSRIAARVCGDAQNASMPASETDTSTIDRILAALGVYAGASSSHVSHREDDSVRRLQEKIAKDDFDVFMAHNSLDKPAVLEVGRRLRHSGVHPWIDVEQIPPGRWFQNVIQSVMPKVKAAAIFLGPQGLGRWQALKIRSFVSQCVERSLPVIPILLPGVKEFPGELVFLRELNYVRFETGVDEVEPLRRLLWGITGKRPEATFP